MNGAALAALILDLTPAAIETISALVKVWTKELTMEEVREILEKNRTARQTEQDIIRARMAAALQK
jgi:predicted transcriptional regulator